MAVIDKSALLPHRAEDLFQLVADIERYPEFLNGCTDAKILDQSPDTVVARLKLSRAGLSHSFVTKNRLSPHERIDLELVDGPFEAFQGYWQFRALSQDACKVQLVLSFKLRSGLMHAAAGKLFDRVALDLVDAVVDRARYLFNRGEV